jgi:hypothetical protein
MVNKKVLFVHQEFYKYYNIKVLLNFYTMLSLIKMIKSF